jgi:hypothetical protein
MSLCLWIQLAILYWTYRTFTETQQDTRKQLRCLRNKVHECANALQVRQKTCGHYSVVWKRDKELQDEERSQVEWEQVSLCLQELPISLPWAVQQIILDLGTPSFVYNVWIEIPLCSHRGNVVDRLRERYPDGAQQARVSVLLFHHEQAQVLVVNMNRDDPRRLNQQKQVHPLQSEHFFFL